jgi:hypothetical protein
MTPLDPKSFKRNDRRREPLGECRRESVPHDPATPGKESKPRSPRSRIRVHDEAEFRRWEEIARRLEEKRNQDK